MASEPHSFAQRWQPRHSLSCTCRVSGSVLLHLARAGAAAHADVLDGAAKAGGLVALEVGQADEDIGVHDGAADLGRLAVFAVGHRHLDLIGAAQAVADEDLAARGHGPEAVLPGRRSGAPARSCGCPGYRVLQSVRKGRPPCSLHRSATTLA